jgi:uncharacterized protein YjbI with pentapeptide repeats
VKEALRFWERQPKTAKKVAGLGLNQAAVIGLVILVVVLTLVTTLFAQALAERGAITSGSVSRDLTAARQLDKLDAEIQKIRSETAGSLFWLKMIGLFVTVGSAVGGYLIAHTRSANMRLQFERRNEVIRLYQGMVEELSSEKPILRAAAAVRLGAVLEKYPSTWEIEGESSEDTKQELVKLTKQVLASSLTIETEPAVLKVLSISIARHKVSDERGKKFDMTGLDLSSAKAIDAYWADCNLSRTDLYNSDLRSASLRRSTLHWTQFRDASLVSAVLSGADCDSTNFKRANLREADLEGIRNWTAIADIKQANIWGVRNAPEGFVEWARSRGALSVDSDEVWHTMLNGQFRARRSMATSWTHIRKLLPRRSGQAEQPAP